MTLALYGKSKQRQWLLVALGLLALIAGTFAGASFWETQGARAAVTTNVDAQGPNDEPGQKDLTQMTFDPAAGFPTAMAITWNWDETGTNGNNTMDACALFDTDSDLNANFSLCQTTTGDPGTALATTLYSCNDSRADRCAGAAAIATFGSTCTVGAGVDPFPTGSSAPVDRKASCNITLADFGVGVTAAALLDVCSYPSAQPNSDPSDCILAPTGTSRTVRVMKVTTTAVHPSATFTGTISPGGDTSFSVSLAANGAVSAADDNIVSTLAQTVTESAPPADWTNAGYFVQAATGNTLYTCSGTESYTNIGGSATVPAGTGDYTVCVKNTYAAATRTIRVVKVSGTATNPGGTFGGAITPGGADAANQAWSQTLGVNGTNTNPGETNTVSTAAQSVTETTIPSGWTNAGFYFAVDTAQSCPGTGYSGTSASIPANTSNYLVCVLNTYAAPSVTIDKDHSGDGTYNLGESFNFTIKFTVANGPTVSAFTVVDSVPAAFAVGTVSPDTSGSPLHCSKASQVVTCVLDSGAATGDYTATIPVTVNAGATCGQVTNSANLVTGAALDTDTVTISGCGDVTIDKSDAVHDGTLLKWTITLNNASAIAKTALVYDQNTLLVANTSTCSNVLAENPDDYYSCEVPAVGSAQFVLSTAYPEVRNVCESLDRTNTAYLAASTTAGSSGNLGSDGGTYHENATAAASCLTVKKVNVSEGVWNIIFTNTGPTANVNFSDTYEDGPTNTDIVSVLDGATPLSCTSSTADTRDGCDVSIPNGGKTITVNTGQITGTCDRQTVSNTVAAFFGTGSPQGTQLATTQGGSLSATYTEGSQGSAGCLTVTKTQDALGVTAGKAYWDINVVSTDDAAAAVYLRDSDAFLDAVVSGGTCDAGDTILGNGLNCSVDANSTLILRVYKNAPAATCASQELANTVRLWAGGPFQAEPQTSADFTANGTAYTISAVASADCLTVQKVLVSEGIWNIIFTNTGPTANVNFSDTYEDGPTNTDIVSVLDGATPLSCASSTADTRDGCGVSIPNGGKTITVNTGQITGICGEQTVSNTVAAFFGTGNPQGLQIGTTTGGSLTATYTEPSDDALCHSVIRLCKVWEFNVAGELADPPRTFEFNVADTDTNEFVDVTSVPEGGTTPTCILVSVRQGNVTITETVPGGFNTPDHQLDAGLRIAGATLTLNVGSTTCSPAVFQTLLDELTSFVQRIVSVVQSGDSVCTVTFYNSDNQNVLPTGNLRVEKYRDVNGDGDANDPGEGVVSGWDMTVNGPDVNGTFATNGSGFVDFNGLETGDVYSVTEEMLTGFHVTRATVNNVSFGAVTSVNATIPDGTTVVVRFYNQPLGQIDVHKNTFQTVDGITSATPNDDDGWTITVSSVLCQVNQNKQTDANGNASFPNLPLCSDYVVSENTNNPSSPGYTPSGPTSFTNQTPGFASPLTLTFNNGKTSFTPPGCTVGCVPTTPTPTATPTTPTSTPTSTPTPVSTQAGARTPGPASPTPVSTQAGERTPGPGSPTPVAPSTGDGLMGGTASGWNLALILGGLFSLTAGLSVVALARRTRR